MSRVSTILAFGGSVQAMPHVWTPYTDPAWTPYTDPAWTSYAEPAWTPYTDPAWTPYTDPAWTSYTDPTWRPYHEGTYGWQEQENPLLDRLLSTALQTRPFYGRTNGKAATKKELRKENWQNGNLTQGKDSKRKIAPPKQDMENVHKAVIAALNNQASVQEKKKVRIFSTAPPSNVPVSVGKEAGTRLSLLKALPAETSESEAADVVAPAPKNLEPVPAQPSVLKSVPTASRKRATSKGNRVLWADVADNPKGLEEVMELWGVNSSQGNTSKEA